MPAYYLACSPCLLPLLAPFLFPPFLFPPFPFLLPSLFFFPSLFPSLLPLMPLVSPSLLPPFALHALHSSLKANLLGGRLPSRKLPVRNYPGEIGPQGCYLRSCPQKGFAPRRHPLHWMRTRVCEYLLQTVSTH